MTKKLSILFLFLFWLSIVLTNDVVRGDEQDESESYEDEGDHDGNDLEEEEGEFSDENEYDDGDEAPVGLTEADRIEEYHRRGYVWPLPDEVILPNTTGWRQLMRRRLEQMSRIEDEGSRYEGYIQAMATSVLVPNFTEHGFGIARCADEALMNELRQTIYDGLPTAALESRDSIIPGPNQPLLIDTHQPLLNRVLYEMQSYAETWSGMELVPSSVYGFRVYRNESQLYMHIDKPQTHVISFILHIASSEDAEPWPLYIDDYHGQTHEVTLTSGDLLFYESSKLMHGRPKPLNGSWYCSVFVHYFPRNIGWEDRDMELEAHYSVPPTWSERVETPASTVPELVMVETGLTEPECQYQWCGTQNSIKWGGPGEPDVWIAPTLQRYPFHPPLTKTATTTTDQDVSEEL